MDRGRPVHHERTRRPTAFRLALLLSTAVAMGSVAGTASASVDPATYTINPAFGSNVGSEPVTISGPNVDEVVGVFFGRSFVDVQPLGQNQIQLYTPGGLPGNVEVKLDFVGEDDVVVPGGFTYVESDGEPDPDPSDARHHHRRAAARRDRRQQCAARDARRHARRRRRGPALLVVTSSRRRS